jgi:outer membrane protein TolC
MGARAAQIGYAEARLREEKARPLLPTIWLGFSGGAFGGGSNLVPPDLAHFAGRTDFDVRAYWTLLNFGAGNLALQKRRRAEVGQAVAEQSRIVNLIRSEVLSAQGQSLARRQQVDIARISLESADAGYRQDRALLRESLSRPIEAVNSLRLLGTARADFVAAITRSNQSQFSLFVALGSPPPALEGTPPTPPPPMATPLRTPIRSGPVRVPPLEPPGPPLVGH